ncbi:putative chaperone [Bacillus phage vB_BcM_Sam46]|uniref:Putative chaperone n=1 Tax=Bacillus phage vB_BcM_Sam46 TaxID=2719179 RepID=A0A6G9L703_9CAUD|nr:putative chaperone [Bacillus phage vB_BcM_Sam46]
MGVLQGLTAMYAITIYYDGTRNFQNIRPEYVEPVKKLAGEEYEDTTILNALNKKYITQQEFDETMAYKEAAAAQPQA